METVMSYFSENSLWGLLIGLVALFIVVGMLKSLFKMAMFVAVIGLVMVVFLDFKPQEVINKGKDLAGAGTELFEDTVKPLLLNTLSEDDFLIKNENGDMIVEIESLGVSYRLNDLMEQLNSDQQEQLKHRIEQEREVIER